MKKTNFLRLCSIFLIMLFLTIMHSGCKKDLPGQGDSGGGINLQGQVITDFHLSYGAKEISYCKYKLPVSTAPDKSSKYLNTIPKERTYHMSFDLSSGNLNMEIDQMNFSSPVDSWNQGNNNINKLVNDGINVTAFDAGGRKIFSQSASLSKPNPQEIIQSMAEVIDNRPLAQKMQDLSQKGALVKELTNAYAVRTEWNVRDSDGTLILVLDRISSGTRLTADSAKAQAQPLRIEYLIPDSRPGLLNEDVTLEHRVAEVADWIRREEIRTLNVAGPRGSSRRDVYSIALEFLAALFAANSGSGTAKRIKHK